MLITRRSVSQWARQQIGAPWRCYALALLASAASMAAQAGTPFTPADDSVVLERLSRSAPSTRSANVRPDLDQAVEQARALIELAREEGDPRHYGRASGVLEAWWQLPSPPTQVLVLRAVIRQASHDFDAAIEDLDAVLETVPGHVQAWLSKAMILRARGQLSEAADHCRRLRELNRPLVAAVCFAHTGHLGATPADNLRNLEKLVFRARKPAPEVRQWSRGVLAKLARQAGDTETARRFYRQALAAGPRNAPLLGGYADLLLDEGRYERVIELLESETADALVLRRALAYKATGQPGWIRDADTLEARFTASQQRGTGGLHLREAARAALFLRGDSRLALELARENWSVQRESWDARLLLEAARRSGQATAAAPVCDWLQREGIQDARIDAEGICGADL